MASIIDGKAVASEIRAKIKKDVEQLRSKGIVPGLAAVLVGDNPASQVYVRNKRKACEEAGIYSEEHKLPADLKQEALVKLVNDLNIDKKINGILIQLPLPKHIDSKVILECVSPDKDVDGFHPYNVGRLTVGDPIFSPCTPHGVIVLLEHYGIKMDGMNAVVVGRSNIVGKPVALMLLNRNATVTICHSKTPDLEERCREADILIVAAGRPRMIRGDMVKEGAVVVDVGINREDNGGLVGDVDFEEVSKRAGWITPVPGGVGPMTIAILLKNTVESAKRAAGLI
ncbi:MAG TPA: bifunctional methylenetetrahydrofolate dehydrogenase/methenyltetrahydrofolate cyclohydrolase FolD [Nitrospiria bacterium]|nr:bifunctional methylenetetrahydrofolate dehydrogenase/methenyltetrahydrofolate cyclohydrolase FolD [Nitrospiria bacterium]